MTKASETRFPIRRFWQRRRRTRLASLEGKLAAQEQAFVALSAKLARLERDLQVARDLHGRLRREIEMLRRERAGAENDERHLRRAIAEQHAALGQLERAAETAMWAGPRDVG